MALTTFSDHYHTTPTKKETGMRVFWHTDFTQPAPRPGRQLHPLRHVVALGERLSDQTVTNGAPLMEWEQLSDGGAPWTRLVAFGDAFAGVVAGADVFQALVRTADPTLYPRAFFRALLEAQGFTEADIAAAALGRSRKAPSATNTAGPP